jgi:dihydrofolate reductase
LKDWLNASTIYLPVVAATLDQPYRLSNLDPWSDPMSSNRVRVYIASSLDGCIAGPDDDLSWLMPTGPAPDEPTDAVTYELFMADVGALLMGRRTYDVVAAMDHPWPYGDTPVLVATSRALEGAPDTVRAVAGSIQDVIAAAREAAGDKDVYLDGGNLVRQGLDAGLVDELIVTMIPIALGAGVPLFTGTKNRHHFEFVAHHRYYEFLQVTLVPKSAPASAGA